ncbi:MAG: choice-of-anchor D domain-containing protein, partial [Prosthecobacter sp.]|nr:choice-of-anchor D domain-containing protein [Prosthecobacter sp.]
VPALEQGSWTGQVRIRQAAASAYLRASAGMVLGESAAFSVQQLHGGPLLVAMTPQGQTLENAASTLELGSATIGTAADLPLTLRNVTPSSTLTLGAITITGDDAADFTLDRTATAASLTGGAETTVVLRFTPRGPGTRTAQLSIASNSVVDQPLVLTLSGTGTPAAGPGQQIVVEEGGPRQPADGAFDLNAYSTSGLPMSYEILAGPATVDATGQVTPTGANGAVTVRITQPGGSGYGAAERLVTFALGTWPRFVRVFGGQNTYATFAIHENGTLWTWGYANSTGYLGDSTVFGRITPTQVGTASNWTDLAMGNTHGLGRRSDGTLWAWGNNASGQLGDGTTTARTSPVQIGSGRSWARIAAGTSHSAAIATDGTLWTWGLNSSSQLGDGTTTTRSTPTQVGTATNWTRVACGGSFTAALRADGTLWAWGLNSSGQLGLGDSTTRTVPTQVGTATDWQAIACGFNYMLAQKTNGQLWAWGSGTSGQLGTGNTSSSNVPVLASTDTDWVSFSCGSFTSVARKTDGSLWCWGGNFSGQLGDGTLTNRTRPQRFATGTNWVDICASYSLGHIAALRADGMVWVAGETQGMSGLSPRSLTWATSSSSAAWLSLSGSGDHFMALRADGTLWGWGYGGRGSFGNGSTSDLRVLTQIGTENQWAQVSAGSHFVFANNTLAVKKNGTLWGAGANSNSSLGNGNSTQQNSFVQIGTATNWKQVACGQNHGAAVRTDGTLWTWGLNSSGQLGLGDTTTRTSPVQVGTATDWAFVACGYSHTIAIKTNGTLWGFGFNGSGQLGLGDSVNRLSPVQMGTATDWQTAACGGHTLAIKTNGTLWAWGFNASGELGLGDTVSRTSPVQVGTATNWTQVSVSRSSSAALRSDGTVWTSGENHSGQMGNGSTANRLTFTQVGRAGGFQHVVVGAQGLAAILADGSFWTAGAASPRVLAAGRSRSTVSPVLPTLTSQTMLPPSPSYLAWQSPIRLRGSSGLPAQVRVLSGPAIVRSDGGIVPTGTGTVTVLAWQPGDERAWDAAPPESFSFTVGNDITATLTAGGGPLVSVPGFDASGVTLNLTLGFAPSLGQELTLVENTGAGPVTGQFPGLALPGWIVLVHDGVRYGFRLRYDGGDGNDITLTHEVAPQVILGGNITPNAATDAAFDPGATSTSGLPVMYEVVTGPATVTGGLISLTGQEGAVTLRLTQPGNAQFLPAAAVTRTFRVTQGDFRFTRISSSRTGSHTLAVMADGSLWAWGLGTSGRIGDGTTSSRFVPLRIGTATDWQQVSAGGSHSAGIRAGG